MKSRIRWAFLLAAVWAVLVGCNQIIADPATVTPEFNFQQYENEAAFDMLYPTTWNWDIIQEGLIAFAHPESLNLTTEELQANVVIFRRPAVGRFTIDEDLTHYLDSGPLSAGFELVEDAPGIAFDGVESRSAMVTLSGDSAENPATTFVIVARTESGLLYTFSATAPEHGWDFWWPHFQLMLSSVEFNE